MQSTRTESFVNASQELDEVCTWLQRVGIRFSGTRVGKYRALFAALAEAQRSNNYDKVIDAYRPEEFANAVVERAQLVRIHDGLGTLNDPQLVVRLKKAVRSHELYVMDNEDRSGRDFSLELDVAAKFARCGYEIDFGDDADVRVNLGASPLFIECKRLKSPDKIRANINKGLRQLVDRYESSPSKKTSRGMLVLSIGKVVNPELGYLHGIDADELGKRMNANVDNFYRQHYPAWRRLGVDSRSLGVAMQLDAPGRTKKNVPFSLHNVLVTNMIDSSSPDHPLLVELTKSFGPRRLVSSKPR